MPTPAVEPPDKRSGYIFRALPGYRGPVCTLNRLFVWMATWLVLVSLAWSQEQAPFVLTTQQKVRIGNRIWANECGGSVTGLTSWNYGEEFPSLGIGHFIWYPKGFDGPFEESFPKLIAFARQQGARPPALALQRYCPWRSKGEFEAQRNGRELKSLRVWLANSVGLQTDYIIARSGQALAQMLKVAPPGQAAKIEQNYRKVATTSNGVYALIDYVNFKGEGINPRERYHDQGWGLLWVLLEMQDVPAGQPAAGEFARAAQRVLNRRIDNSPPERGEARWREGWQSRCSGYARPF